MPDGDDDLVANLANLWLCGRSYMPSAAAYIADVNGVVARGSHDVSVFNRHGTAPGPSGITETLTGIVFPHWDALRDELQRVLAVSAENMYATADALVDVANLYAEEEGVSEDLLEGIQSFIDSGDFVIDDPEQRPELQPPE